MLARFVEVSSSVALRLEPGFLRPEPRFLSLFSAGLLSVQVACQELHRPPRARNLDPLELVVNTVSMEEAVQQQQEGEALTLLLLRNIFMTEWTVRLSTGYNVQVNTELYLVTTRDRAC